MVNPGRYDAVITASEVMQAKSGAYMIHFVIRVEPPADAPFTIHSNVCFVKADGAIMQRGLETLVKLFPRWDRQDFNWFDFQDNTINTPCSVVLDWGEFNGKQRMEVKWLNAPNIGGNVAPKGVKVLPAIASQLRAALAAMPKAAAPVAKPAPASAVAPSMPAPSAPVSPTFNPQPPEGELLTYNSVWTRVSDALTSRGIDAETISKRFIDACNEIAQGRDLSRLAPYEYGQILIKATT